MPQAEAADAATSEVDGIVRIRRDFARAVALGNAEVQILVHGTDANTPASSRPMRRARSASGRRGSTAEGKRSRRRPGRRRRPAVVQRGQRQPLFPGARPDRAGHDADRRACSPRWSWRANGSAARSRRCSSRRCARDEILLGKTIPYFVLGMIGLALCICSRPSFCSTCRSAARCWCWPACRCSICWSPRHRPVDLLGGQEPVRRQPARRCWSRSCRR